MRNLLLLSLLISTSAFGKEQYACFEAGNEDPLPKKLVIDVDLIFWWPLLKQWEVHGDTDFCNLSFTQGGDGEGKASAYCFKRAELKLFETYTLFGGLKNDDDDTSFTLNKTFHCISNDSGTVI